MQREAHCRDPILCHTEPLLGVEQCGMWQSKQEFLRRCRQMRAKHADGPEAGMLVHGKNRPTEPVEQCRCGGRCPICVFSVHPLASAFNAFLLAWPRAALGSLGAPSHRASQHPDTFESHAAGTNRVARVARRALPTVSPCAKRDDGETHPGPAQADNSFDKRR